ncbi:MAG: hypothetical protein JHD28_03790, partial [Bacteroidia bacterium]|nr:hypothetical protein [Bacteroidia bacterium]
ENRYRYSNYEYNNISKFVPKLKDVEFSFQYLFDAMLAVQVKFTYTLTGGIIDNDTEFGLVKMYYISLKNGQTSNITGLFETNKINALEQLIQNKTKAMLAKNQSFFNEQKAKFDELDIYDENTEMDNETDIQHTTNLQNYQTKDIKLADLTMHLNPFFVTFMIPSNSPFTQQTYGFGFAIRINISELKSYVKTTGLLSGIINWKIDPTKNLHGINIHNYFYNQTELNNWRNDNPYQKSPGKGVKSVKTYIQYQLDSSKKELNKQTYYTQMGQLQKEEYFSNDKVSSWNYYEYDVKNRLSKIIHYEYNDIESSDEFSYDDNNNLIAQKSFDQENDFNEKQYFYMGNQVYELEPSDIIDNSSSDNEDAITIYELNAQTQIINSHKISQEAEYTTVFDKGKIMASYSLTRPKDARLFTYNKNGQLHTVEYDNNRYLNLYEYDANGYLTQESNYDSRMLKSKRVINNNAQGLPLTIKEFTGMYGYSNHDNAYYYSFDYEFWNK